MKKLVIALALATLATTFAEAQPRQAKRTCTFNACMSRCVDIGGPPEGNGSSLVQYHCGRVCQFYTQVNRCAPWLS